VSPLVVIPTIFLLAALLWWAGRRFYRRIRRRSLLSTPLPQNALNILRRRVPLYNRLTSQQQTTMQGCINRFLFDMVFVGCNGFEIDDEVRLTVAGNACLLVFNREQKFYSGFESILIYPDTILSRQVHYDGLVETHYDSARAGESWYRGPLVLSWTDVERGLLHGRDGHNVILHEFAHKLDEENRIMDGLPVLREPAHYREWAQVLTREYDEFRQRVEHGSNTVIDEYGAVSAVEFFAVATESFFEKPTQMHSKLPDLYRQFQQYYGLDPARW
jgi:Mlc titration factor MtfA (ptsG expression regulator)